MVRDRGVRGRQSGEGGKGQVPRCLGPGDEGEERAAPLPVAACGVPSGQQGHEIRFSPGSLDV